MKLCQNCNKEIKYTVKEGMKSYQTRKFCSRECIGIYLTGKKMSTPSVRKGKKYVFHAPRICIACNKDFYKKSHEPKHAFQMRKCCSRKCYITTILKPCTPFKLCQACGGLFSRRKGENYKYYEIRKFCNIDCYALQVGRNHAEKNPAWKGGMVSFSQRLRNTSNYRNWRDSVLNKDNKICIECKSTEKLEADHIIPFFYFLKIIRKSFEEKDWYSVALKYEPLWDINNGRTLCLDCHKKTDTYMYKAKNYIYG